ncbi:MAG TPA: phosphatase PAP2 family protein [Stellaceae bacterium]|nr:phosphatase PAP2 family protein [Stellaceae bacterium]
MKGAALYGLLVVAATALFLFAPGLDLAASWLFYEPGRGFVLAHWAPALFVSDLVPWIAWGVAALVAAASLWLVLVRRPLWRFDRKALLFIAAAVALGPGLLVNTVLKDHWGRARPVQIARFGGLHHFTPAPLPAAECASNCSFVCGHAALGFALVAFAFLLPPGPPRRRAAVAALAFGAFIGLDRIALGRHFLSDVVFAGLLVYGTTAALYWWIVVRDGLATPPLVRLYRWGGHRLLACCMGSRRLVAQPAVAAGLAGIVMAIGVTVSAETVDRPAALYFHQLSPGVHALFALVTRLGLAYGYLTVFALAFAILHWGGRVPRLRPLAPSMRALSAVPAFLFAAVAASGLAVDLLKVIIGRTRPKLLFAAHLYGFDGLALRPDHWSFPSGHSATIVALAAALTVIWPRHVLFYALIATVVAVSRVVVGAHYPSDVVAGAFIAVVTTRLVAWHFHRWGIDFAAAKRGSGGAPPWPCRRFARERTGAADPGASPGLAAADSQPKQQDSLGPYPNPLSALQDGEGEAGVGGRSGIPDLIPTLSAPEGGEGALGRV